MILLVRHLRSPFAGVPSWALPGCYYQIVRALLHVLAFTLVIALLPGPLSTRIPLAIGVNGLIAIAGPVIAWILEKRMPLPLSPDGDYRNRF